MQHSLAIYTNNSGVAKRGWGTGWDSLITSPALWVCIISPSPSATASSGKTYRNCGFNCVRNWVPQLRTCMLDRNCGFNCVRNWVPQLRTSH